MNAGLQFKTNIAKQKKCLSILTSFSFSTGSTGSIANHDYFVVKDTSLWTIAPLYVANYSYFYGTGYLWKTSINLKINRHQFYFFSKYYYINSKFAKGHDQFQERVELEPLLKDMRLFLNFGYEFKIEKNINIFIEYSKLNNYSSIKDEFYFVKKTFNQNFIKIGFNIEL